MATDLDRIWYSTGKSLMLEVLLPPNAPIQIFHNALIIGSNLYVHIYCKMSTGDKHETGLSHTYNRRYSLYCPLTANIFTILLPYNHGYLEIVRLKRKITTNFFNLFFTVHPTTMYKIQASCFNRKIVFSFYKIPTDVSQFKGGCPTIGTASPEVFSL